MSPGEASGAGELGDGLIEGILQAGPSSTPPGAASELLTFLFADIRGYTRFTQQHGDEAAAKLTAKFAAIVRDLVSAAGGIVFELRGDEAMCVFTSPRRCLRLAVDLQRRFVDEMAADADLAMTVGIGVDAGEAVRGEDGYRGGALNLAARLCSRARAGDVLASPEVTHLAGAIDGLRYVVQDAVSLKGITHPVRPVRVLPSNEDPAQQIAALVAAATPATSPPAGWLPGPLGRLSGKSLSVLAAVVAVVVAAVVVGLVGLRGSSGPKTLSQNSVGILDPKNGHVVDDVAVDAGPLAAAGGLGAMWSANTDANTVSRIDASDHQVSTIGVGSAPSAIAVGLGAVWVANSGSGTVTRIDPSTNDTQTISVGTAPGGLVVAAGSVWVTDTGDGAVSRIDPARDTVVQTVPVGDGPSGISGNASGIWVADSASNTVSKIPIAQDGSGVAADVQPISVGNDPTGVAVLGSSVWVTNNLDGTLDRIAVTGNSVADTVRVGLGPTQLTVIDGKIWVGTQAGEAVDEIDPGTNRLVRTVHLGAIPGGLAPAAGQLWVTATINPALHRGGTLRIVDVATGPVDPVYIEDVEAEWLDTNVYDGLVGYRHSTGADAAAIVPDLATTIPTPTNNGLTYVFQLRQGIRWSNGAPLTAADVRRGIERGIAGGFSPLGSEIAGAADCTAKHCVVSGITIHPASHSVTITLKRPNQDFLSQLASYSAAAPADTPLTEQSQPIPGTGPYRFSTYQPKKLIVLTRNPYFHQWSAAAQPAGYPDRIEWRINGTSRTSSVEAKALDAVAGGTADFADARGAGAFGALQARFGSRLFVTPTETTQGLILNTRVAPFNNVLARRAVAFAVDRAAVQSSWFTNASITCQVLPPDFPAHRPYCPYTLRPTATGTWSAPDVARGQALVKRSGTTGATVSLWTSPTLSAGMRPVVAAMNQIGYHAHLYVDPKQNYFNYIADSRHHVQAASSGWVADDVTASDFFVPLFTCSGFIPGSERNTNYPEFCSPSIDQLMNRALKEESSSPQAANLLWAEVDRRIVDAAPFIPITNPTWVDVVSRRVQNYQRSPVIGVLLDQMWVR